MTEADHREGYGDQQSPDELLSDYILWLHKRANQLLGATDNRHEDLVQEGLLAMWQAYQKYDQAKGSLPAWLTRHANWRMKEVLSDKGRTWTGKPPVTNGRTPYEEPPIDDGQGSDTRMALADGMVPDIAEALELAYHHGEIQQAISELTPKQQEYVRLRFWEDMRHTELRTAFGYDPSALWNSRKNGARFKLQDKLGHLRRES